MDENKKFTPSPKSDNYSEHSSKKKKRERDVDQIELKSHEAQRRSWRRGGGRGCGLKTLRAMKSSSTGENSLGENRIRRKPRDQMS